MPIFLQIASKRMNFFLSLALSILATATVVHRYPELMPLWMHLSTSFGDLVLFGRK